MKRTFFVDSLLVCALTAVLIWPLFRLKYSNIWSSIESTFISDARMLNEHWPHTGWQPLWYCGTRFDYIYPPALRYGTALISKLGHMTTARAYHLYTAIFYVFGIVAVYWMVRIGTGSRVSALLASAWTALLSPSFLFLPLIRIDAGPWIPQRLHVLASYGEGPHLSALCTLPAVIAASFLALRRWRPGALALAAILCALVVANNFYGATALTIFFPILVWSVWLGEGDRYVWLRAAGIAVLAYGLSAFWLTPSYVRITLTDLRWVAHPGNQWSTVALIAIVAVYCAVSYFLARRRPEREWSVFVAGAAVLLTLDVLGVSYFEFRIIGEGQRLIPEMDLAVVLAGVEVGRALWGRRKLRVLVVLLAVGAFAFAIPYLSNAWVPFPGSGPLEDQYPYRIANWVHEQLPGERVLPSGEVRFWFDTWADNADADGGSQQGMLNQILPMAFFQILAGDRGDIAIAWLQALGTDAVIVPGEKSLDPYRDYKHPEKFRGVAPVLYDDGHGTTIYRVPRLYPNIGRIVDRDAMARAVEIRGGIDTDGLGKYLAIVESPNQPATTISWKGFDDVAIDARASAAQSVLLQETYDPAWHAYENGKRLPIRREPVMGFMLIDVPEGSHAIRMHFETPLENRVGWILFGVSLMAVVGLLYLQARSTPPAKPAKDRPGWPAAPARS
jgi:hypothetical protein